MSRMFQRTVEGYKYQAKVALFTGKENPELIEKYLDIIDTNWFEGKWVKKYRGYLHDPEALRNDPEYQMFLALDQYEEIKFMSSAVAEDTLLKHYTSQPDPQGVMLDQALAASMTMRHTAGLCPLMWPRLQSFLLISRGTRGLLTAWLTSSERSLRW